MLGTIGQTITPTRTFDAEMFNIADQRTLIEIPLPLGHRWLVVSRARPLFYNPADRIRDREVGGRLRIVDSRFWEESSFLISVRR